MIMPPEPDYEAVIANEFRMARAEGTRQALIRFIARHADHRLADEARALLHGATRWRKVRSGPADPDADVYAAFDRALQTDTAEGYEEFIARHSSHPLSQEAQRLRRALLETGQDEPTQD